MAKLQIKSEKVATFGGIFHVMDVFEHLGLGRLIDLSLGKRDASWNAFRYSEVIETLFCNYLCGGDCLEDINMLAPQLALRVEECMKVYKNYARTHNKTMITKSLTEKVYECTRNNS